MAEIYGPLDLSKRPSAAVNMPPQNRPGGGTANEPSAAKRVAQGGAPPAKTAPAGTTRDVGEMMDEAGLPNLTGAVGSSSAPAGTNPADPMAGAGSTRVNNITGSAPGPRPMPGAFRDSDPAGTRRR
jgi:hypothetical protein